MGMMHTPKYGDFRYQVLFELLVQLVHVYRLDGNSLSLFLVASMLALLRSVDIRQLGLYEYYGPQWLVQGIWERNATYYVDAPVDLRKAPLPNVVHPLELSDDLLRHGRRLLRRRRGPTRLEW
jgi:hypothetical protein